jgi:OmpR-family two-component system manganese-sensing response regulator
MGVYADLLRFKVGLLDRVRRELPKLHPVAQQAAAADLAIIEGQMQGYQARLDLWYRRLWELQGLRLDPEGSMIRHRGREARLTRREYQMLQFLLDHPHRSFTATQLLARAWSEPSLFPEEVRNYVRRVRKILAELEIPVELVNVPSRGYSLVFRPDERPPGE